jgi:hypothetical protein
MEKSIHIRIFGVIEKSLCLDALDSHFQPALTPAVDTGSRTIHGCGVPTITSSNLSKKWPCYIATTSRRVMVFL